MKITLEFLEALLVRGWAICGSERYFEFRTPEGHSGTEYWSEPGLTEFPPAVEEWIRDNIPLRPCKE